MIGLYQAIPLYGHSQGRGHSGLGSFYGTGQSYIVLWSTAVLIFSGIIQNLQIFLGSFGTPEQSLIKELRSSEW